MPNMSTLRIHSKGLKLIEKRNENLAASRERTLKLLKKGEKLGIFNTYSDQRLSMKKS